MKMEMERMGNKFPEEGREWRIPGLLYTNNLGFCSRSEEDLKVMMGRFVEVCRSGLKINYVDVNRGM